MSALFLLFLLLKTTYGFDLSAYNINSTYYTSSLTILTNRAYLALPRTSCYNNNSNPTLVEVHWPPEIPKQFRLAAKKPFFIDSQDWHNCDHLQNVVSVDAEPMRVRLWALDTGGDRCPAKLAIYSIFQRINYTINVPNVGTHSDLATLVVDAAFSTVGTRAYVGRRASGDLLVFSFNEFKWWTIRLENDEKSVFSSEFLALSRREPLLYVTGGRGERGIFGLDLKQIRIELDEDLQAVNVSYLGEKLGDSSGLVTDLKEGLIYYLVTDYAIVRWDTRKPSIAEHYNILGQSYDLLPTVSDLFTGPQNGIWALINSGTNCDPAEPPPTKRTIKLLKYNLI